MKMGSKSGPIQPSIDRLTGRTKKIPIPDQSGAFLLRILVLAFRQEAKEMEKAPIPEKHECVTRPQNVVDAVILTPTELALVESLELPRPSAQPPIRPA